MIIFYKFLIKILKFFKETEDNIVDIVIPINLVNYIIKQFALIVILKIRRFKRFFNI